MGQLGFHLKNEHLKRAALDYRDLAMVFQHKSIDSYLQCYPGRRFFLTSTRALIPYTEPHYEYTDSLVFGPEDRGLPKNLTERFPAERLIGIPMRPANRSLNLSNAVAIVAYEAWSQLGFEGSVMNLGK